MFWYFCFRAGHPTSKATNVLERIVVDMVRDMMDVQFYTGEYASKKFEVARDLLPELYQGLARLKEQLDGKEHDGVVTDGIDESVVAKSKRRFTEAEQRAHRVLTRLATSMLYDVSPKQMAKWHTNCCINKRRISRIRVIKCSRDF